MVGSSQGMPRVSFHGSFYTESSEAVQSVLRSWLSVADLVIRHRHGIELRYVTDDIEFLCYETMLSEGANFFLIEGVVDGSVDVAVASLRRLAEQSLTAGMKFDGEYEQVDTDGCSISEEIAIG